MGSHHARGRSWRRRLLSNPRLVFGTCMLACAIVAGVFAAPLSPFDPQELNLLVRLESPTLTHLMGTDMYGRDQFSRLLLGARISLAVAALVAGGALAIGFTLGLVAGFQGGWIDQGISRVLDLVLSFPWLLTALAIAAIGGPGLDTAILALTIAYIPIFARMTRSVVLNERSLEYVEAAQVIGASRGRIMLRHIAPNIVSPLVILTTSVMAYAVLAEAALSYLGLGAQPPSASWGRMLTENSSFFMTQPYLAIFPGLAISWLVLALNLVGDGLRDALDPRQAKLFK